VDAAAWSAVFTRFGAALRHVHRPTLEAAEAALDNLCTAVDSDMSVVVILAGRAVSAPTPGLLLDGDVALPYASVAGRLTGDCGTAGLTVAIVDAGFAGATFREMAVSPRIVWQASDDQLPGAPRLEPLGGGLLTAALTPQVFEQAQGLCLGLLPSVTEPDGERVVHPTPDEVARAFLPAQDDVVAAMRQLRLERIAGTAEPADSTLRELLLADIPDAIFRRSNALPEGARCNEDATCGAVFFGCDVALCQTWRCEAQRCVVEPADGQSCDDDNPCTEADACLAGACVGTTVSCDDDNSCTIDLCSADEGCLNLPYAEPEPCDDGNPCTDADACGEGGQCVGVGLDCDDDNPCTEDGCDVETGECAYDTVAAACDDGDACTQEDYCQAGLCRGLPILCDDGDPCTSNACDSVAGVCFYPDKPEGAPCEDDDPCTLADTCQSGVCDGTVAACDDGLDCTLDLCDSANGSCQYLPAPGTCATPEGCIDVGQSPTGDPCQVCVATNALEPANDGFPCADDGIACTADVCGDGECQHLDQPGFCHKPDGTCVGVGESLAPCLVCSGTGVASPSDVGTSCDDGDPCTSADVCTAAGLCEGTQEVCCAEIVGEPGLCAATVSGTTAGGTNALSTYTCNANSFNGPEAIHQFVAPCAGQVLVTFNGPPSTFIMLVRGDLDTCAEGSCDSASPVAFYPIVTEGELLTVVVDGLNGAEGPYTIEFTCPSCP